jgi:hypothetical protein
MHRFSSASKFVVLTAAGLAVATGANAASYRLSDHPAANENPPPYGLRLDGLFAGETGANGGITTFSFNTYGNTILNVFLNGSTLNITINGTVFGGEDTGSGTGFGAGDYQLSMTYTVGVTAVTDGWKVDASSGSNFGTLTALTGALAGDVFNLSDDRQNSTGQTFAFLQDDHRLGAFPSIAALDPFVGRGWLNIVGNSASGTRDLLFLGELIPSPLSGAMAGVGLVGLAARRRR